MLTQPDDDYCVHGRPVSGDCFFCRTRGRTVAETQPPPPTIPEHRNPKAAETSPGWRLKHPALKPRPARPPATAPLHLKKLRPPAPQRQPDRLAAALDRLKRLEDELAKMQATVAQTVAEIRAAQPATTAEGKG